MQRDTSIDALRGLAIGLVVVGHAYPIADAAFHGGQGLIQLGTNYWVPLATATDPLFNLIFAFHMALFAFVSGFVLWPPRDRALREEISRRARSLLVPYVGWFFIHFFVMTLVPPHPQERIGTAFVHALLGSGGLWYLYALFICSVLLSTLSRLPTGRWLLPLSAVAVIALSGAQLGGLTRYLYLGRVIQIYPFVVLGYVLAPIRARVLRHRVMTASISLVAFGLLYYLYYPVLVPDSRPSLEPLAVALHEAGIGGGHVLRTLVDNVIRPYALPYLCAAAAILPLFVLYAGRQGRIIDAQAWLGRRSLGIYAIHSPLMWSLAALGAKNVFVLSVTGLALSTALVIALERIPLTSVLLLGRYPPGEQNAASAGATPLDSPERPDNH